MANVQIFLSAVSAEFRSYRDALRHDLERPNMTVKVQEDFIVTGTETLDMLDHYILHCDAVIHLVGDMTGATALAPSVAVVRERYPDFAERLPALRPFLGSNERTLSYTQWEAWLALYHRKPLFICVPTDEAQRDGYLSDAAQRTSQQEHLERLASVERFPGIRFANSNRLAVELLRSRLFEIIGPPGAGQIASTDLIDFAEERGRQRGIVVRDELVAKVREWIDSTAKGWILIKGAPGTGTSAVVAAILDQLEREFGPESVPHHFLRRGRSNWGEPGVVLRNLIASLARISVLGSVSTKRGLDRLHELLALVAAQYAADGRRLVLIIDGLEQATVSNGSDQVLGQFVPTSLPDNVVVVCGSRSAYPPLSWLEQLERLNTIDLDRPPWLAPKVRVVPQQEARIALALVLSVSLLCAASFWAMDEFRPRLYFVATQLVLVGLPLVWVACYLLARRGERRLFPLPPTLRNALGTSVALLVLTTVSLHWLVSFRTDLGSDFDAKGIRFTDFKTYVTTPSFLSGIEKELGIERVPAATDDNSLRRQPGRIEDCERIGISRPWFARFVRHRAMGLRCELETWPGLETFLRGKEVVAATNVCKQHSSPEMNPVAIPTQEYQIQRDARKCRFARPAKLTIHGHFGKSKVELEVSSRWNAESLLGSLAFTTPVEQRFDLIPARKGGFENEGLESFVLDVGAGSSGPVAVPVWGGKSYLEWPAATLECAMDADQQRNVLLFELRGNSMRELEAHADGELLSRWAVTGEGNAKVVGFCHPDGDPRPLHLRVEVHWASAPSSWHWRLVQGLGVEAVSFDGNLKGTMLGCSGPEQAYGRVPVRYKRELFKHPASIVRDEKGRELSSVQASDQAARPSGAVWLCSSLPDGSKLEVEYSANEHWEARYSANANEPHIELIRRISKSGGRRCKSQSNAPGICCEARDGSPHCGSSGTAGKPCLYQCTAKGVCMRGEARCP